MVENAVKRKEIKAHAGFQENFVRSACDVVVGGGAVSVGKSFAAVLACGELMMDGNFRGVCLRNNIDDLRAGGGMLDIFSEVYGRNVKIVKSDNPRVEFIPTGSVVEVTHVADQTREKVEQRFKGRQLDWVYFDEGTGFTWETFVTIATRNRGKTGKSPQILITTNPKRKHWLRKMVDWYIGEDGCVRDDREGKVRYFFVDGTTVEDLVWGSTKEEVYAKCKVTIDRLLKGAYGRMAIPLDAWKGFIKSFVYYQGRMAENVENLERNAGYLGSVAMAGGANALNYIEGNWNADPDDERDMLLTFRTAEAVLRNDPQRNGDRWVTADLADTGTDNFVALAWDGFHVIGALVLGVSTPRENAERLRIFAREHDVAERHIIFDAMRGRYINDYIPDAVPFESYRAPMGLYAREYLKLKDECYGKLVYMLQNGGISIAPDVARSVYAHQRLTERLTFATEFTEECRVVRFVDVQSGKRRLMTKKEMNKELGRGRSMDVLDPFAMRMLPVLDRPNGEEMTYSPSSRFAEVSGYDTVDVYDDTAWF